jgi:hypothetical protein
MPELRTIRGPEYHPDLTLDTELDQHTSRTDNPHQTKATDVVNLLVSGLINQSYLSGYFGQPFGIADLDSGGKIPASYLPSSISGGLNYRGTFDASSGVRPDYPALDAVNGDMWAVNVAGTWDTKTWLVGDFAIYNGSSFEQVGGSAVVSVNGLSGAVVLEASDIDFDSVGEPGVTIYDKVLSLDYEDPIVTLSGGGLYEVGDSIANPYVSWTTTVSGSISSQTLTDIGAISPVEPTGNRTFTGANLTTTKTYTMDIIDDQANNASSDTVFTFTYRRYWGMSEDDLTGQSDGAISSFVLSKFSSELAEDRDKGNLTFTPSNWPLSSPDTEDKYLYYVFPQSWGLPPRNELSVNGVKTTFEVLSVSGFTNQFASVVPVYIMKSAYPFASPVIVDLG